MKRGFLWPLCAPLVTGDFECILLLSFCWVEKRKESNRHPELIIMTLTSKQTKNPKNFAIPGETTGEAEVPCTSFTGSEPKATGLFIYLCAERLSSCGAQAHLLCSTGSRASVVWTLEHKLSGCGAGTGSPQHVGSSYTRDQTHACCIVRRISYH